MTTLDVPDGPKQIREALCYAQTSVTEPYRAIIQRLINECDRLRPIGPDGKHGEDRHTGVCGCDGVRGGKLVRDGVPALVPSGEFAPVAEGDVLAALLMLAGKLQEEAGEVRDAVTGPDPAGVVEELADVMEVLYALTARLPGVEWPDVLPTRRRKESRLGGFRKMLWWVPRRA